MPKFNMSASVAKAIALQSIGQYINRMWFPSETLYQTALLGGVRGDARLHVEPNLRGGQMPPGVLSNLFQTFKPVEFAYYVECPSYRHGLYHAQQYPTLERQQKYRRDSTWTKINSIFLRVDSFGHDYSPLVRLTWTHQVPQSGFNLVVDVELPGCHFGNRWQKTKIRNFERVVGSCGFNLKSGYVDRYCDHRNFASTSSNGHGWNTTTTNEEFVARIENKLQEVEKDGKYGR